MDQCSNIALPVRLAFWRQHPQHINKGGVKYLTLAICLGVIWTCSELLGPHLLTDVGYQLTFKNFSPGLEGSSWITCNGL